MDELRFYSLWDIVYVDSAYVIASPITCRSFHRRWRIPVIKENRWECESPVDESRCANLGRFLLSSRMIARFIRVASRIIAPHLFRNGIARSRLRGFLRGHVERRVLISAACRSNSRCRDILSNIIIERSSARIESVATESRQIYHVRGIVLSYHSSMSLWHGIVGARINARTREPTKHSSANISHVAPINDWRQVGSARAAFKVTYAIIGPAVVRTRVSSRTYRPSRNFYAYI